MEHLRASIRDGASAHVWVVLLFVAVATGCGGETSLERLREAQRLSSDLLVRYANATDAANRYLREHFIAAYNRRFSRRPTEANSAFLLPKVINYDQVFCHEELRIVGKDNTVVLDGVRLQIPKQPGRRSCENLQVKVRRHLDGRHSVWWGTRELGRYDAKGQVIVEGTVTKRAIPAHKAA